MEIRTETRMATAPAIIRICHAPVISSCQKRSRLNCKKRWTRLVKLWKRYVWKKKSMAKSPVFDTSVFSPFSPFIEPQISYSLFPSIVFYELTATSIDESILKRYERWRITLSKIDRVLTPSSSDWWETAKSIRRLYLKKIAPVSKLKTLQNDALIARLAVKNKGFVVTMDVDDYEIIRREMPKLEVVPGDYFFS